jgi:adenylylsulfate kinase-like enzyme
VFVATPLDICEEKDIKGLYKKARLGQIKDFTGVRSPYEAPTNPDITLHPQSQSPDDCCKKIIQMLIGNGKF